MREAHIYWIIVNFGVGKNVAIYRDIFIGLTCKTKNNKIYKYYDVINLKLLYKITKYNPIEKRDVAKITLILWYQFKKQCSLAYQV